MEREIEGCGDEDGEEWQKGEIEDRERNRDGNGVV